MTSRETWFLVGATAAVIGAVIVGIASAPAPARAVSCEVTRVGQFNAKNDRITAQFEVKGAASCKQTVSLASWQAPDGTLGLPYDKQKLFSHTTGTFGAGKHTLTTKLPNCYFQTDLVRGSSAADGQEGAKYSAQRLMGVHHGGTQKCATLAQGAKDTESGSTPGKDLPETGTGWQIPLLSAFMTTGAGLQYFRQLRHQRLSQ